MAAGRPVGDNPGGVLAGTWTRSGQTTQTKGGGWGAAELGAQEK